MGGLADGERQGPLPTWVTPFEELASDTRQRLMSADTDTLLRWSERILTATSLEEFFSDRQ